MSTSLDTLTVGSVISLSCIENQTFSVGKVIKGGMGIVYQLLPNGNYSNPLAMKTLQNTANYSDFNREAEIWISLGNHQYIARGVIYDEYDGVPYVLCDWYHRTLDRIDPKEWNADKIVAFVSKIIVGLQYAQDKANIIHQDIKPTNIMVDDDDNPRISDFGLAKFCGHQHQAHTPLGTSSNVINRLDTGALGGTIRYMAPELLLGFVDTASVGTDIYSLGVTLYEWLTGEHPYIESKTECYRQKYPRLPLANLVLRYGLRICSVISVIDLSLRTDPHARPSSYDELLRSSKLPMWHSSDLQNDVDGIVSQCSYLRKNGRADEAYKILNKALRTRPTNPILLNSLGLLLHAMGRMDDGNTSFESAYEYLNLSEGTHRGHLYLDPIVNLAGKYIIGERFFDAAQLLEKCANWIVANKKIGGGAYVELGWLFLWDGHFDDACAFILSFYESCCPDKFSLLWLVHAEYMSGRICIEANSIAKLILDISPMDFNLALTACLVGHFASMPLQSTLTERAYSVCATELDHVAEQIGGTYPPSLRPPISDRLVRSLASSLDLLVTGGKYVDSI